MEEDRMELPAYPSGLGYSEAMEVQLAPELQAKIDQWVMETGLPAERLIEDALAGYVPALAQTREMLDSRYDDLKSGRVKPIDGEAFFESLRQQEDEVLKRE
jgi:hypothetical protein